MPKFFITLSDRRTNEIKMAGIAADGSAVGTYTSRADVTRRVKVFLATQGRDSWFTVAVTQLIEDEFQGYQRAGMAPDVYYTIAELANFGVKPHTKPERTIPQEWHQQVATPPQIDAMYRDAEKIMFWAHEKKPTQEAVESWIRRTFGLLNFPAITKAEASIAIDKMKVRRATKLGRQNYSAGVFTDYNA